MADAKQWAEKAFQKAHGWSGSLLADELEALFDQFAAEVRESCARKAEEKGKEHGGLGMAGGAFHWAAREIATAIREMKDG